MVNLDGKTLRECSICGDKTLEEYFKSCPGCNRKDICEGCFLKERDGSGERCLECAIPFCGDCAWQGTKTSELKPLFIPFESIAFRVCPVCDSPDIFPVIEDDTPLTEIPDVFKKFLATVDLENI